MIYFIALICLLLPSYLVRFTIFGIPTTLLEVLIYLAAIITISKFPISNFQFPIKSKKPNSQLSKFLIPVFLFLLSGIISVIIAPDKHVALGLFKAYIIDPIILFWIIVLNFQLPISNFQKSSKSQISNSKPKLEIGNWKLEILIKSLILSGVIVAIQAIWQKMSGEVTADGRVIGIFGYSPNYLAFYLAPIAVLINGVSMNLANRLNWSDWTQYKKIWPYDAAMMIVLIGILLSGSRAAMGAVVVGIAGYFVIRYWYKIKSKKIYTILFYCLIALLLVASWQIVKPDWSATRDSGRISSSNNIRWEIWRTTARDILPKDNNWLVGVGLGNYQNYFTELTKNRGNYPEWISPLALTPHNIFLTLWVNLGLLGLVSFIVILYQFYKSIIFDLHSRQNPLIFDHSLILITVMSTIILQGIVDAAYWKNDLAVMFWLLINLSFWRKKEHE